MKFWQRSKSNNARGNDFEILRSRLESAIEHHSFVAITSSTDVDGKEAVARGLAQSLATAGYSTLLVNSSLVDNTVKSLPNDVALEDVIEQHLTLTPPKGAPSFLSLSDAALQRTSSQRDVQAGFDALRRSYDFVISTAEYGASTSFATSLLAVADAVLVSVRKGRQLTRVDSILSDSLDRIGPRFLGAISIEPSLIDERVGRDIIADTRRGQAIILDREQTQRQIA